MARRYRISGLIKFYEDDCVFENEKEAKKEAFEKPYLELSKIGIMVIGGVKVIQKKIEDIGPAVEGDEDWDIKYPPVGPPEDW